MKKHLLLLLAILFSLNLQAAEYDETNLIGLWKLESHQGEYFGFDSNYEWDNLPHHLYLGTLSNPSLLPEEVREMWEEDDMYGFSGGYFLVDDEEVIYPIADFFISSGNKLHIDANHIGFRFIIENLTAQELKLKSYDGNFMATFKREGSSSIQSINEDSDSSTAEYYNLKGLKQNTPHKGVNIVRNGKKTTKEIR